MPLKVSPCVRGDRDWMAYAIRLGQRALGTTAENPPVGCVLVRNHQLVGVGWTQVGGRPHAEAFALAMAGEAAKGATAYVTLEPCAHQGKTAPCAQALIDQGVSRVVAALEDPDERVSGRGFAILRDAGIETEVGLMAAEASIALAGFLSRKMRNRPYVTLKLGVSADGKIAGRVGERTQITGPHAMARVQLLRAQSDAILIGLSTALVDNPALTCRLPGLANRSPVRIVADSRLSLARDSLLVQTAGDVPVWVLSTIAGYIAPSVTVLKVLATAGGWVDFRAGLHVLAERGINRLLVEGGSHIARSFLTADLVDEVQLFQSPRVIGEEGLEAISGMKISDIASQYLITDRELLGEDVLQIYRRAF